MQNKRGKSYKHRTFRSCALLSRLCALGDDEKLEKFLLTLCQCT